MISSIGFKNYKAFASGELAFKPITILLGANSVGKSSIIQLILMLLQSATDKADLSALKTNGEIVSFGNIANLFRDRNTAKPSNYRSDSTIRTPTGSAEDYWSPCTSDSKSNTANSNEWDMTGFRKNSKGKISFVTSRNRKPTSRKYAI